MAEFNLADILKNVPKMDTGNDGREQIEYIELEKIDPDPRNFYELSGLEELAANIELLGLQQPLRVRDNPVADGHVIVVSGHRRRAALAMLADEGKTEFQSVPCIREQKAGSDALQELRLIYANSDTRRMTSAETAKQVERVEALLYQLKEDGMEFPGRMRDHVAEACKVSKSKIARLKVIREGLDAGIAKKYETGEMNEAVAYAFARQPVAVQREIYDRLCIGANGCKYVTENQVENYLSKKACLDHDCKIHDGKCTNAAKMLDKIYASGSSYVACSGRKNACCLDCYDLKNCSASCVFSAEKKAELRAARKAEINEEKEKARRSADAAIDDLRLIWSRFREARTEAGKSFDDIRALFHRWEWILTDSECKQCEAGEISEKSHTPFGVAACLESVRIIRKIADCLDCSTDYLLGRDAAVPKMGTGAAAWTDGTPKESGLYVMETDFDGMRSGPDIYRYDADNGGIRLPRNCYQVEDMICLRYIRLPED